MTSAWEGLSAKGLALWPYKNRTVGKISLQQPFPGTGKLQAGQVAAQRLTGRLPHRCPVTARSRRLGGGKAGESSRLRALAELRTQTLGSGDIKKARHFRTECRGDGAVDRAPGICRGARQVFGRALVHVWEETPRRRREISRSRRQHFLEFR